MHYNVVNVGRTNLYLYNNNVSSNIKDPLLLSEHLKSEIGSKADNLLA